MPEAKISITSDSAPKEQTQSSPDPKTSPINPTSQLSPFCLDPSGLAAQLAATQLAPKEQAQARAAARKIQQSRRQAHATSGVSARYYPAPDGREEVPILSEADRDLVFSFNPITVRQVTRINKLLCTTSTVAPNQTDGTVIKIKSSTQEERLALAAAIKVVKAVLRTPYLTRAVDYIFAPTGLSREIRASTRSLLEDLSPRHIIEMARHAELAIYQDAAAEAKDAWGDPIAEGLLVCPEPTKQPRKLNAALVKHLIQALGERRKLWPEVLRPLIDDLINTLRIMVPSKIPEFIERIIAWLKLSSQELLSELKKLGQQLPNSFAFLPLVHPNAFEQAGEDIHKLLATYLIVPKTRARKAKAKAQSKQATQDQSKAKPTTQRKPRKEHKAQPAAEAQAASATNAAAPSSIHLELEDLMEPTADKLSPATDQAPASAAAPASAPDTAAAPAPAPAMEATPLSAAAPCATEAEDSLAETEAPAPSKESAPLSAAEPSAAEAEAPLAATEAPAPSEAATPLSATELSAAEPTNELLRSEAAPSTAEVATATPAIATSEVATAESNDSNASAAPARHVASAVTERLILKEDELDELEGLTSEQLEVDPEVDAYPVGLLDSAAFAQTTQAATDLAPAANGDNQFSCVFPDNPNQPRNEPYLMELEVDSVDIDGLGLTGTATPELSAQRIQDQRNRKQRKADHKRERKLRQAQRRRK